MIAIADYGIGNLFSLKSSFKSIGEEAIVTSDEKILAQADKIIFPGVGAFGDAAAKLHSTGLGEAVIREARKGKPLMGICLGMQLLFEKGYEYGEHDGLGLIPGDIRSISEVIEPGLKIPQIGWNALNLNGKKHPLFRYINEGDFVYFVHSFHGVNCGESIIATTEYSGTITAAVAHENVWGCQFHPEKSGTVGLKILKAFCEGVK